MSIPEELAAVLICPKCRGSVVICDDKKGLRCDKCKLKYPIKDDIPIMLIDSAVSLEEKQ